MGKRIRVQRRGRGGSTYRASTHKRVAPAKYPLISNPKESSEISVKGVLESLVHDSGRGAPLAFVRFENGETCYTVTPEGVFEGQQISFGGKAPAEVGNILPLGKIP
jgi:large subunit ribosomal protein L2